MPCVASVELTDGKKITAVGAGTLKDVVSLTLKKVMKHVGCSYGATARIQNQIPLDSGLGDKEAVASASCTALLGALAEREGGVNELKIDKFTIEQFVVVKGKVADKLEFAKVCCHSGMSFDRLVSCFYGGFSVCDNQTQEILRRGEMESLKALLLSSKQKKTDSDFFFPTEREIVLHEALKGNLYSAMKLNALFDAGARNRVISVLDGGALAVAVSGGSVVGLFRDDKKLSAAVKRFPRAIVAGMVNHSIRCSKKPRRIYSVDDFLKLKGDWNFHVF